jgi:hypothetical protein
MAYMLLVVEKTNDRRSRSPAEAESRMNQMTSWGQNLTERGLLTASESLKSDQEAVRVQVREGRRSLVDGPFAEAKEMIGGFFLLTCERREDAIATASECPAARWATIEVREIGPCTE